MTTPAKARRSRAADVGRAIDLDALRLQNAGVVYAFAVIVITLTVITSATGRADYLSPINVSNVLDQTSLLGILAISMTVVLITGNFDLSIGSVAALSGGIALLLIDKQGTVLAVACALGAGVGIGLLNGILVQLVGINAFIVTLGTLTAVRGLVLIITNGNSVQAQSTVLGNLTTAGPVVNAKLGAIIVGLVLAGLGVAGMVRGRRAHEVDAGSVLLTATGAALGILGAWLFTDQLTLTYPVYFMILIMTVVWAVLRFTVVGRRLYATGGNPEAARLSGIDVNRYKIAGFVLNGLAAAWVGILYAGKFNAINPNALTGTELTVLAAAILGGTSLFGGAGSVIKSVIGTLILFTLANGFNILNLGANYQGLIQGIVIVVAAGLYTVAGRRTRTHAVVPDASQASTAPPPDVAADETSSVTAK